jgi:hypothetical protein
MKAQPGSTYAQIVAGRVRLIFTAAQLPEWNEAHIDVRDVTGITPTPAAGWYVDGNTYSPDPITPEDIADKARREQDAADLAATRADALITALVTRTPAQIDAYMDANVTSLATARDVLKILAKCVAIVARAQLR